MSKSSPQPVKLPKPPSKLQVDMLKDMVQKEVNEKTKNFDKLPTPVDFVKLEGSIGNIWLFIKGIISIGLLIASFYGGLFYLFYSKIDNLDAKVSQEAKVVTDRYLYFDEKISNSLNTLNQRIDNVIFSDLTKPNITSDNAASKK